MSPGRGQHGRRGRGRFAGGAIRRFLEPVLLLLLHRSANHGYDLVGALEPFGLGDVAPGPVYRTLRDLEATGLIESEWDVESSGGPARRVYRLTQAGQHQLHGWVEELQETDRMLTTSWLHTNGTCRSSGSSMAHGKEVMACLVLTALAREARAR